MTSNRKPTFSILHTSSRPEKWREIFEAWMGQARLLDTVEYILCVDERWGFKTAERFAETVNHLQGFYNHTSGPRFQVVWNTGRRCYVDGVNTAAKASTGDILIVNADDQYPMEGWDSFLWQKTVAHRGTDFVVECTTGTPKEETRGMLPMPIVSRQRYLRLGYLLYPGYESMFSDVDLYRHAKQDGVIIDGKGPLFPHKHPMFNDKGEWLAKEEIQKHWTDQYAQQNRKEAYSLGAVILKWREKIRFGDAIREAEQIEGWMTTAELEFLSKAASQCDTVVELGSWMGRSTYAICSGTAGNVYAVDRWDWKFTGEDEAGKHYSGCLAEENSTDIYDLFRENTDKFTNLLPVRKTTVEAAQTIPDADMVFVDAGHEYEEVKADILAWLPKTKKLICGHDYSDEPAHAGVVKAVHELLGPDVKRKPGTNIWYKELASLGVPGTGAAIVPNGKIIAWCLPGEVFQAPILSAILKLYAYLTLKGYCVVTHQAWTSSPYVTREALRLSVMGMQVQPHYVLWSDDDNPISPETFEQLMKDIDTGGVDCVAGWTWVDMYNGNFAVSAGIFSEDKNEVRVIPPTQINSETKLIEVEWHGFPVVLMKYDTLVKAGDKPFAGIPAPNSRWGVTGEDVAFCTNLKARSDCRLFVDPLVFVPHLKFGAIGPKGREDVGATVEEMSKI